MIVLRMRAWWAKIALAWCVGVCLLGVCAQAQGTADIPLDDNAYVYIDALLARGVLQSLSSLERPYSLAEVRTALNKDDSTIQASRTLRGLMHGLRRDLAKYDAGTFDARTQPTPDTTHAPVLRYQAGGDVYATAQTSSIRELMLSNDQRAVYPGATVRILGESGPVTVAFRGIADGGLIHDPEFMEGLAPRDNARMVDGYIDARWPLAEIFFGRESRNWGPSDLDGLLLGHYVFSYDHLYVRLGPKAVHLEEIVTRLNDVQVGDTNAQRYFSIHRLAVEYHRFEAAVSESIIYGGPGQSFDFRFLNPVSIYWLSQNNENSYPSTGGAFTNNGNKAWSAEMALRTRRWGTYSTQGYLDDFQIVEQSCSPLCQRPASYGMTFAVDGFPFIGAQRLFANYTRVTNLSYRNDNPWEAYDENGIGLGRGYADYDQATAGIDVGGIPGVPLKLYASYRRQGQGDYHNLVPPADSNPYTPTIFSGIVSKTVRLAVSGAATAKFVEFSADVGINRALNYNHVLGDTHVAVAGELRATLYLARIIGGTVRAPSD